MGFLPAVAATAQAAGANIADIATTADAVGWSADAMEAQAFAYLAARVAEGLPLTFPTTTGAPQPMTGGMLARAPAMGAS